ncbi:aspartyl-phosphate phosphatase Spo0E family protein [Clostridium lundense]|nr:aspartyl-phosphate phosphatase Spo0E family protein [Clostridium lundense]
MNEENVRKELHDCIDKYGIQDIKTLKKSQELDEIISNIMAVRYIQASIK